MIREYDYNSAVLEASRCLMCDDSPCKCGCPSEVDARKFIRKIRFENLEGAVRYIKQANVLAASCSYICPSETLCSLECSCKALAEPIDIRGLQRFVMEWERTNGLVKPISLSLDKAAVAVVGSGPAGLGVAADLAVLGYKVTVFDSANEAGGILRHIIPTERLPTEVIDSEIEFIKMLGVEFRLSTRVGDLNLLFSDGFKAVFLATGAWEGKRLGINGELIPEVFSAMEFLSRVKKGEMPEIGERVVVIGGGDTAIDSARVAKKMGKDVTVIYRRTYNDMPAHRPVVGEALKEGVDFIFRVIPRAITGAGKVEGVRCVRVRWRSAGRGETGYSVEGAEFNIPCNAVIVALGQGPRELFGLRTSPSNYLAVDNNMMTSREGVFAGGDVVTGPKTAVAAVGAGKKAAVCIDRYLSR